MREQAHRLARALSGSKLADEGEPVLSDPAVDLDVLVGDLVGEGEGGFRP